MTDIAISDGRGKEEAVSVQCLRSIIRGLIESLTHDDREDIWRERPP